MSEYLLLRATRVRLSEPAPNATNGHIGNDWSSARVENLRVLYGLGVPIALCVIDGKHYNGPASWIQLEGSEGDKLLALAEVEQFKCPDCAQVFENAQGLGNHRATKHNFGACGSRTIPPKTKGK